MDNEKDRFGDKIRLVEKAREDTYFAARDREAIEKLREQLAAGEGAEDQKMVDMIDQALAGSGGMKHGTKAVLRKILVPIDFSDCSRDALAYAVLMAVQFKAKVTLMHVIESQGLTAGFSLSVEERDQALEAVGRKLLGDAAAPLEGGGLSVTQEVRRGVPYQEILHAAEEQGSDLIVMGTNGRTGLELLLLGSVAEKVVRLAKCPVLTIHPSQG